MDADKITQLIKRHFAEYQQAQIAAQLALAKLQAVAEAGNLQAEQVNEIIGVSLFSDASAPKE